MNIQFKSSITLLFALFGAGGALAAPLSASSEKNVLFVTQTVTPGGASSVTAQLGPLTTSDLGFGIDRLGQPITNGVTPGSISAIDFAGSFGTATGLPTKGQALDIANDRVRTNFPFLQQSMSSYMTKNGINSGWFNFKEEVNIDVNGVSETWTVYWDYFADQSGRGAYADAQLIAPDPKMLYVVYTSKAVDQDLPAGWQYAEGGTVKYQLRNMKFQPVTNWVTVNVNGAFDSPQATVESRDAGLKCLTDVANPGCPPAATDVKRLLDQTGAAFALVDYVRRVKPVYSRPAADGTKQPVMVTRVDTRDLTYIGCNSPVFRNTGRFGYELDQSIGRYLVTGTGSPRVMAYGLIQEYQGSYLSPTQSYDFSLKVPKNQAPALGSQAIDPVKGNAILQSTDIPGLQSMAQLNIIGSPSSVVGSARSELWQYGGSDDRYYVSYSLRCSQASDGYEIVTEIDSQRHSDPWIQSPALASQVSTTDWSPVALAYFAPNRYLAYADMASGVVWLREGAQYGYYEYRSTGGFEGASGDFVDGHNKWSMQQPASKANYSSWSWNSIIWDCGTSAHPYHYIKDGSYMGYLNSQKCSGYTNLRGFYMSNGAPYWANEAKATWDPSESASYQCDYYGFRWENFGCGYFLKEWTDTGSGGGG